MLDHFSRRAPSRSVRRSPWRPSTLACAGKRRGGGRGRGRGGGAGGEGGEAGAPGALPALPPQLLAALPPQLQTLIHQRHLLPLPQQQQINGLIMQIVQTQMPHLLPAMLQQQQAAQQAAQPKPKPERKYEEVRVPPPQGSLCCAALGGHAESTKGHAAPHVLGAEGSPACLCRAGGSLQPPEDEEEEEEEEDDYDSEEERRKRGE